MSNVPAPEPLRVKCKRELVVERGFELLAPRVESVFEQRERIAFLHTKRREIARPCVVGWRKERMHARVRGKRAEWILRALRMRWQHNNAICIHRNGVRDVAHAILRFIEICRPIRIGMGHHQKHAIKGVWLAFGKHFLHFSFFPFSD